MNDENAYHQPPRSPRPQLAYSPRPSARASDGGARQGSVGALADHVPNIQLGGPKPRPSTGAASPRDASTVATTPRSSEGMPPTVLSHHRSPGASLTTRVIGQQQPASLHSRPSLSGSGLSPRPSYDTAGSSLRSSRTSSASTAGGMAPSTTSRGPASPRPHTVTTTTTTTRSPKSASAKPIAAPLQRTASGTASLSSAASQTASPRGPSAPKSVRHPHSLRTETDRNGAAGEGKRRDEATVPPPPVIFAADKEKAKASPPKQRKQTLKYTDPTASSPLSVAVSPRPHAHRERSVANATPRTAHTSTTTTTNTGSATPADALSPRPSGASLVSVSAMKSDRYPSSARADAGGRGSQTSSTRRHGPRTTEQRHQQQQQQQRELANEFFRFHYYYYPDDVKEECESVEKSPLEAPTRPMDGSPNMVTSQLGSPNDVSELDGTLHTPPTLGLSFGPSGEAPFTPRGMPVSPFLQRLAEVTATGATPRGTASTSSRFSPLRRVTMGTSTTSNANSTSLRSNAGGLSPPPSSLPVSRRRLGASLSSSDVAPDKVEEHPLLDTEDAVEEDEDTRALREELKAQLAATSARLAKVTDALKKTTAVVDHRAALKAMLDQEREEIEQQAESLQARTADVANAAKDLETRRHTSEELAVLRDMLAEREQRLEALEAKRDALAGLWEQLQILHEEAQQQETQRREQRRRTTTAEVDAQDEDNTSDGLETFIEEDGREASVPLTESERQIKKSMIALSQGKSTASGDISEDSPLGPPRPEDCGEDADQDEDEDEEVTGDWTDEEPEAVLPTVSPPDARRGPRADQTLPSVSVSPSMSCARGPSMISAGTADILQSFLGELYSEMDSLAMICIQKPSPPAATQSSRVNRAPGLSAWSRDINTGNNGFFSFFGGATEAHLSAKPLSTFLSCASRLARSAWRMEAEVQLRARELATEEEEEELRRRLNGKPAYEPAPVITLYSEEDEDKEDEEDNAKDTEMEASPGKHRHTASHAAWKSPSKTPTKKVSPSKAVHASPELSRSAGRRRRKHPDADLDDDDVSPRSAASPLTSPIGSLSSVAPQIFLPSLAYAAPRLPMVSRQLDAQQLTLQKEYEHEIEAQRSRRRALVKRLKETYRHHVEPQLVRQRERERQRQETLARELVALGVAEVCLQWEEMGDEEDDAEVDGEAVAEARWTRGESPQGRRNRGRSGSGLVGRPSLGDYYTTPSRPAAHVTKEPAKYLRQVIVRALQVTEPQASVDATVPVRRTSTSTSLPPDDALRDTFGVLPMVSSTRHRLQLPEPLPLSSARTPRTMGHPHHHAGASHSTVSTISGARLPLTPRSMTTAGATTPLKTVLPLTPSPLKGRAPTAGGRASGEAVPRSARGTANPGRGSQLQQPHSHTRDSLGATRDAGLSFTEETRERLDAAGRPLVRASPLTTPQRGGAAGKQHPLMTPPSVNLLGTNPTDSPEVLDTGAVKVSLLFFGEEAHRRQEEEAEKDRHMREFWALREELARVDETNFILANQCKEAEDAYSAQRCRHAMSTQEAMEKLIKMKKYHAAIKKERGEWREMLAELEAARDALALEQ